MSRADHRDRGPDLEPYGYPLRIDGHEYKAVPQSWVDHGRYRTLLDRKKRYLATSAAYVPERDVIRIRYVHATGPGVIGYVHKAGQQNGSKYPSALESGRFDNVVTDRFAVPRERIRLGERARLLKLHRDYLVEEDVDVEAIEESVGGESR